MGEYIMNNWIIKRPSSEPEEEGFLGRAKRVGISSGLKAAESIEGLASLFNPVEYIPELQGKKSRPTERLKRAYDLTPEYLAPQNDVELGIQKFAQAAPLGKIVPAAAGATVAAGASALGLPEFIQDIAQVGTELLTGRKPSLTKNKSAADTALRAAVKPTEKHIFTNTATELGNIADNLGTAGKALTKKVKEAISPILKNLKKAAGNPVKLLDVRKWLGKEIYTWSEAERLTFGEPLRKAITQDLVEYGANNPTFLKNLNTRDQLSILSHMKAPIADFIAKAPFLNKYLSPEWAKLISTPEKMIRGFVKLPAARSLWSEMASAAIENNPDRFIKAATDLKDYVPELQQKKKRKSNGWIIKEPSE